MFLIDVFAFLEEAGKPLWKIASAKVPELRTQPESKPIIAQ